MPSNKIMSATVGGNAVKEKGMTADSAREIALDFLKKTKNTERVQISVVEQSRDIWVIRGTCPIDLEGHPWAERFEVVVDTRGKVKSINFALL